MSLTLLLPLVIPLATAVLCLAAWSSVRAQQIVSVAGGLAHVAAAVALVGAAWREGILVGQAGGWQAPYGISLVADLFGAAMVLLGAITGLACIVYSLGSVDERRERHGYYALVQVLLFGVTGSFMTGDLFNLYVWFEVMLMASFVLLALGGERPQLEGAVKYVTLNLVASGLFLASVGILYGMLGTLNFADMAVRVQTVERPLLLAITSMLLLAAFLVKAGAFPFFFWLPASYHTPPVAVAALFAGLLTKVGVYAVTRVYTLIFTQEMGLTHGLILGIAGLTMVTGVLGAATHMDIRRILSFHIISQIGYMLMGVGLAGIALARAAQVGGAEGAALRSAAALGLAGTVFYIIHHIIVKANLFLVGGVIARFTGSYDLKRIGGLYKSNPWLAVGFLVPALSLAGIPILSGFWAKLVLVKSGIDAGQWVIVGTALAVSLLTLYSMTKIWAEAFWKDAPANAGAAGADPAALEAGARFGRWATGGPIAGLAVITVVIGLGAGGVYRYAERAAGQLLDPQGYIEAVLGVKAAAAGDAQGAAKDATRDGEVVTP